MSKDCQGAEDGDSFVNTQCCKDFYMPQNSVRAEDGDSYEYNECCKDSYMPQDRVGAEDGESSEYNMWYHLRTATRLKTA